MHNRTRMIAAAAAVSVALAAGSAAAIASTTGAKPTAPATAKSAEERQGHAAITAAVAQALHVSAARVGAALRPLFAAGRVLPGSGLGLAIVRKIADMHDGTVEAIPLQQGVQFRISIPECVKETYGARLAHVAGVVKTQEDECSASLTGGWRGPAGLSAGGRGSRCCAL